MAKANSNYVKNRLKISLDYPFKWDTEKSHDSAQYDTVRNLTPRRMILRRTSEKYEYLGEILTKIENILIQWSVAQAGSNDEKKTGGRKSRWTVPLIRRTAVQVVCKRNRPLLSLTRVMCRKAQPCLGIFPISTRLVRTPFHKPRATC